MITGAYLSFWDKFKSNLLEDIAKAKLKSCDNNEIKKSNKLKVITYDHERDGKRKN